MSFHVRSRPLTSSRRARRLISVAPAHQWSDFGAAFAQDGVELRDAGSDDISRNDADWAQMGRGA
ncbi:MAG: hypothetical protein MI924_12215 [Chloroflexales bacterium]|nr:hypothetical protein [Chloroflexales bacterium]